jgi:hypothetical protein
LIETAVAANMNTVIPTSKKHNKGVAFFFHCGIELAHQAWNCRISRQERSGKILNRSQHQVLGVRSKRRTQVMPKLTLKETIMAAKKKAKKKAAKKKAAKKK